MSNIVDDAVDTVRRGFVWLQNAVEFNKGQPPFQYERLVRPSLDIGQRGWGHVDTVTAPFQWTATVDNSTYDLITGVDIAAATAPQPNPGSQFVIHAIQVLQDEAESVDVYVRLQPAGGQSVIVTAASVPAGNLSGGGEAAATAASALLVPRPLWVPPGYRAQLDVGGPVTTLALTVTGLATIMRAGFAGGAP